MEINRFISSVILTTAASSAFALSNQEIVNVLNQQAKQSTHHVYQSKQINTGLNWASLHGPRTGNHVEVVQMKNNASMLFAFSNSVLYKSIDGGQNWDALTAPKGIKDLISIDGNRLVLAAEGSIYTSTDQGEHWILSVDLGEYCDKLFVVNPDLLLLQTNSRSSRPSLFRSKDGGKTWAPARLGLNFGQGIWGMGGRDNLLFVSAYGLNISTNGGALWTQPEKWKNYIAYSLAVSSKHDVFVATSNLYKTDPAGLTWEKINTESIGRVYQVQIDNHDRIYVAGEGNQGGLYRSVDNGKTWELLQQLSDIQSFSLLDNGKIIVSTRDGLMEYDESQRHFSKLPISFSASTTQKVFALDEKHIFAIDSSLFNTHDGGKTWERVRSTSALDVAGLNNEVVALEWDKNGNDQHVLSSADQGLTWQEVKLPSKKICHTLSSQSDALILACDDGQYLTRDLSHWKIINSDKSGSSYLTGQTIYHSNGNSIKLSKDEGKTWITLMDKLNHYSTHMAGYQDKVVLAAISSAGIIKTTDGGTSWELIGDGITDFYYTGFVALNENTYIVTTGNGAYITHDGGKHWVAENDGLDNLRINSLFANQDMVIAGTNGSGVFKAMLNTA